MQFLTPQNYPKFLTDLFKANLPLIFSGGLPDHGQPASQSIPVAQILHGFDDDGIDGVGNAHEQFGDADGIRQSAGADKFNAVGE